MTTNELERLVRQNDIQELVAAVAELQEPERRKLAKTAAGLFKAARDATLHIWQTVARTRGISSDDPEIRAANAAESSAALAVLALCGWSEVRRIGPQVWGYDLSLLTLIEQVLRTRRPDWLEKWINAELTPNHAGRWGIVRQLVRAGGCAAPNSDAYIIQMIRQRAGRFHYGTIRITLADVLRGDPDLLKDEIWRIFEIDYGRQCVLSVGDGEIGSACSWGAALVELSNSGEIDRQRLLSASLLALNRRFQVNNASWFCRLHEKMEPTKEERLARQGLYMDLLSNTFPVVVGFTLGAVKIINHYSQLDVARFTEEVGSVFGLRSKTHPLTAVRILRLAAKQTPEQNGLIARVAARGLAHRSPEVQEACVDLMEAIVREPDPATAEALVLHASEVAASQRQRVAAILNRVRPYSPSIPGQVTAREQNPPECDAGSPAENRTMVDIMLEGRRVAEAWCLAAGIDACLQAIEAGTEPPAVAIDPLSVPRLASNSAIPPIETFDALLEGLSAAVEKLDESEEFESLLDALSRQADYRPYDFVPRTAPLLKRVNDLLGQNRWISEATDPQISLRELVRAWIQEQPLVGLPMSHRRVSPLHFISARLVALAGRLHRGVAAPLLAAPTHRAGWLDPRVLVRRLQDWPQGEPLDRCDLIQALLRMAPDHRAVALGQAEALPGEVGSVLRYALGGSEPGGNKGGHESHCEAKLRWAIGGSPPQSHDTALWIAAARARRPDGAFLDFSAAPETLGPDAALPASYSWEVGTANSWRKNELRIHLTAAPAVAAGNTSVDRPTVLLNEFRDEIFPFDSLLGIRCRLAIWPVDPEAMFACGAQAIASRLDSPASSLSPASPYFEPLFDPDTPFSEMAQLCVALGLLSKDAGARGMAIDVMLELIKDGRCIGKELGALYSKLSATKYLVRLNRLADALAEVARASILHRHAATSLVEALLASLRPPAPDDLHYLLTPLREWLAASGRALTPACNALLHSINGGGKTAKLAGCLKSQSGSSRPQTQVYADALRARIARAKRWQQHSSQMAPVNAPL